MTDTIPEGLPEDVAEETTPTQEAVAATPAPELSIPWIVIHENEEGHPFATRISGPDADTAEATVLAHHTDNLGMDVLPDNGETEVGYGGAMLPVNTLDQEP